VVETDSGLKYENIECGDGTEAARGDTVTVHYTGTLEDGGEFDSSEGKDPLTVRLGAGEVIAGFEEGLIGMSEGGTRELTIPPDLGYGPDGFPPAIPPDATLIFEIRLIEVDEGSG
jgi:FKBP-type peptidyl-prolyl cis-trans isomerase